MPGYRGHIVGALAGWSLALVVVLSLRRVTGLQAVEWACAAIIGGLFPDLDTKSMGQKWMYRILFAAGVLLLFNRYYQSMSAMLLVAIIPLLVRHRGLLHNLLFLTGVAIGAYFLLSARFPMYQEMILLDTLFFWMGTVSHLWLDCHGPFSRNKPGARFFPSSW
jgi:membrane-bound metal-dependent hydrolase YbcI (DUF457 family)